MNVTAAPQVRFGIFWRLLLVMVVVSVSPVALLWYVNHDTTLSRVDQQIRQDLDQELSQLSTIVDGWADMNQRALKQTAALADIRGMQADKQTPVLKSLTEQYPWVYLAFTVAPDGSNIARSDGKPLTPYGDRKYVKDVLAGAAFSEEVVIGKTSGKPALILATAIRGDAGQLVGVLAIATTVEKISDQIIQRRIGETGSAFLVDESGKVIAHQSEEFTKTRHDLSNHPAVRATREGGRHVDFSDDRGVDKVGASKRTQRGWALAVQQDREEAYAALEGINRDSLLLLAFTIIPVVLVALLVSRSFSRPIRNLTQITEAISVGNIDLPIEELRRNDEIGVLAAAIDRLRTSMSLAMARLRNRAGEA